MSHHLFSLLLESKGGLLLACSCRSLNLDSKLGFFNRSRSHHHLHLVDHQQPLSGWCSFSWEKTLDFGDGSTSDTLLIIRKGIHVLWRREWKHERLTKRGAALYATNECFSGPKCSWHDAVATTAYVPQLFCFIGPYRELLW